MNPLFAEVKELEQAIHQLLDKVHKDSTADLYATRRATEHFDTACMWLTRSLFPKRLAKK